MLLHTVLCMSREKEVKKASGNIDRGLLLMANGKSVELDFKYCLDACCFLAYLFLRLLGAKLTLFVCMCTVLPLGNGILT